MVELSDLDENKYSKIIRYKQSADIAEVRVAPCSNNTMKAPELSRYISEDGETVARAIRQKQKRLTEKELAEVVIAYQSGKSADAIAAEYGCDRKTICAQLKAQGIAVSRSKIKTEEGVQEIIALYERGQTSAEIAKLKGVSASSIQNYLKKNGVKLRGRWG
ncbi:MAG: hypothetical protein LBG83_03590 [Oscillospiraceae bacterium]|jgi:DNA-binding CsgD family transcriptional regulator|nr:hypothetical protein [Oscillospiraceae bacterium]